MAGGATCWNRLHRVVEAMEVSDAAGSNDDRVAERAHRTRARPPLTHQIVNDSHAAEGLGPRQSLFMRSEVTLAHAVYGLILTVATLGELIHHEVSAPAAVLWLLGAGAVLLAAHLFSDILAHTVAAQDDPDWSEIISVGREDLSVVAGSVGAALVMAIAAVADLDSQRSLVVCAVLGLVSVAALTYYATLHHRLPVRLAMSAIATVLCIVIVGLENTV